MTVLESPTQAAPTWTQWWASPVNATLLASIITFVSFLLPATPLAQVVIIIGMPLVLGSICLMPLHMEQQSPALRLVVALALGVLLVFVIGAIAGSVLPPLGVAHPLSSDAAKVIWSIVLLGASALLARADRDPLREVMAGVRRSDVLWCGVLSLPPLLALIGVARLNADGTPVVAVLAGCLAVVMTVLAIALPHRPAGPPRILLLASALVTAAWQGPMRGGFLFVGDIQHEYYVGQLAISQGSFPIHHDKDPYAGMLSLTVWPAQMHALSGISLRVFLALLPSVVLALCVVTTWCTLRERVTPRIAATLCALLLLGSYSILREMPGVSRECYALLFFTVLIFAVSSRRLPVRTARTLAALSGLGMALSHYSSAYIAAVCVVGAWLLALVARQPRETRVLTFPVAAAIAGTAAIWGAFVAKTGTNFSLTLSTISGQGFQFLPGKGNVLSRWLHGANISKLVSAAVIRRSDLALRKTVYHWMKVDPAALAVPFRGASEPRSHGVAVLGPIVGAGSILLTELVLVAAVLSVGVCLWRCRSDRRLLELSGLAAVGVLVAAVSRSSQTLAVQFGPTRVQLQVYLVFVVTLAVTLSSPRLRTLVPSAWRPLAVGVCAALAGLAFVSSSLLSSLVEHNAQLVSYYSNRGDQVARIPIPQDLAAAQWLVVHRPVEARQHEVLQSDWDGQYVMNAFGFWVGRGFVPSIDPVLTDEHAWILATHTNVVNGQARGGNSTETGSFVFPRAYLTVTRPALYVSGTDVVYGSNKLVFEDAPARTPASSDHSRR